MWSSEQIEQWQLRLKGYNADNSIKIIHGEQDARRETIQVESIAVFTMFLDKTMTLAEFNRAFQQKTHGSSNVFGLGGTSGGMFLIIVPLACQRVEHFFVAIRTSLYLVWIVPTSRRMLRADAFPSVQTPSQLFLTGARTSEWSSPYRGTNK